MLMECLGFYLETLLGIKNLPLLGVGNSIKKGEESRIYRGDFPRESH